MKRDHRPYFIKYLDLAVQKWYVNRFLRPQFECLGTGFTFMKPWYVEVFGGPINLGDFANVIATPDKRIRLTIWSGEEGRGSITIGSYCLLCPGVRISAACDVSVGDNCMMAQNSYITDSDWHAVYDRTMAFAQSAPVRIGNNAWIGDSTIVCKGVTIGDNSIIGAGSVVVKDVPSNVIAAGNPAVVVRQLDPGKEMTTRAHWFANPAELAEEIDQLDRRKLRDNTICGWLRSMMFPRRGD